MDANGNATCPCRGTKPVLVRYSGGSTVIACECTIAKYEAIYGFQHEFTVETITQS